MPQNRLKFVLVVGDEDSPAIKSELKADLSESEHYLYQHRWRQ